MLPSCQIFVYFLCTAHARSCSVHVTCFISPLTAFQKKKSSQTSLPFRFWFTWAVNGDILCMPRFRARTITCTLVHRGRDTLDHLTQSCQQKKKLSQTDLRFKSYDRFLVTQNVMGLLQANYGCPVGPL